MLKRFRINTKRIRDISQEYIMCLFQLQISNPIKPWKGGSPDGHGRFSLRGNGDGYIGNVVNGSISHNETLGCLSPAVDSSHPTCIRKKKSAKHTSITMLKIEPNFVQKFRKYISNISQL